MRSAREIIEKHRLDEMRSDPPDWLWAWGRELWAAVYMAARYNEATKFDED